MKQCKNCGYVNEDDARFCASCSAVITDEPIDSRLRTADDLHRIDPYDFDPPVEKFDIPPEYSSQSAVESMEVQSAGSVKPVKPAKPEKTERADSRPVIAVGGKLGKIVEFENKHNVIVNGVIAVCALVIALLTLLVPIKVMFYASLPTVTEVTPSDADITGIPYPAIGSDTDGGEQFAKNPNAASAESVKNVTVKMYYTEVGLSIFDIPAAYGYVGLDKSNADDLKKIAEIDAEVEKVSLAESEAFVKWLNDNPNASVVEISKKQEEIITNAMSEVNILSYILAHHAPVKPDISGMTPEGESGVAASSMVVTDGDYTAALVSLGFGMVVFALSCILALVCLIKFIIAVCCMVKRKPAKKPFSLFGITLAINGTAIVFAALAPIFKGNGGLLAVSAFTASTYFLCALFSAILHGEKVELVVKRAMIAAGAISVFCLLFTDVFTLATDDTRSAVVAYNIQTSVPVGFSVYRFYSILSIIDLKGGSPTLDPAAIDTIITGIVGATMWFLAIFAYALAATAMSRSIKRLALGERRKTSPAARMLASSIFMILLIAVASSTSSFADMTKSMLDSMNMGDEFAAQVSAMNISSRFVAGAQLYAATVIFIVLFVFNIVFRPKTRSY